MIRRRENSLVRFARFSKNSSTSRQESFVHFCWSKDHGASLVELAIILPLIFAFIAALVDFGFKINSIKQISAAARQAARIAASHSRRVRLQLKTPAICSLPGASSAVIDAPCAKADQQKLMVNDSVAAAGRKSACSALAAAGFQPEQWRVQSSVSSGKNATEDKQDFYMARVGISRIGRDCLICYDRIYEAFEARTVSEFMLEEPCE